MTVKYLKPADLDKAIKSIAQRGAKLDADIQVAALSALNHLAEHRDAVFCGKLYNNMPKGSRRSSLALWFTAFGAVKLNTDAATKGEFPFVFDKQGKTDLDGAAAMQWHEAKQEPELEDLFDIKAALAAVLKKATKEGVKVSDPALLRGLNALCGDKPTPAKAVADASTPQAPLL